MGPQPAYLTVFDLAELLGLSPNVVKTLAKRGELPGAVLVGRHLRFDSAKMFTFLDNGGAIAQKRELGAPPRGQRVA